MTLTALCEPHSLLASVVVGIALTVHKSYCGASIRSISTPRLHLHSLRHHLHIKIDHYRNLDHHLLASTLTTAFHKNVCNPNYHLLATRIPNPRYHLTKLKSSTSTSPAAFHIAVNISIPPRDIEINTSRWKRRV
jgi:hypothetical protein